MKPWYLFQGMVAQTLDIFPMSPLQYLFSTEAKTALPCDLACQQHYDAMIARLRPLVVPPILANGHRSTRTMKPVAVQVYKKGDVEQTDASKVCYCY